MFLYIAQRLGSKGTTDMGSTSSKVKKRLIYKTVYVTYHYQIRHKLQRRVLSNWRNMNMENLSNKRKTDLFFEK